MDPSELLRRARLLLQNVLYGCQNSTHTSLTVAVYDSAWVSMVSKSIHGDLCWLFPESFQFILEKQQSNGGWESSDSNEDAILDTLAALLAMKRHSSPLITARQESGYDLLGRISRAVAYLHDKLQRWGVRASGNIGFEILIPAHLMILEQEGIVFEFPQKPILMALKEEKLAKFDPSQIYGSQKTTLLHSLEAFVGIINFDNVRHHLIYGSQFNSPSSTAAYLMNCTEWDAEAETYLRKVVADGGGHGRGGVPGVYPTNIFEVTWVVSTLFEGGYTADCFDEDLITGIISYLEKHLHAQQGLVGFAPAVPADADDTAKTLLTLNMLGQRVAPDQIFPHFETERGYIITFPWERNPSFSANCNVLMAVLHAPDPSGYTRQIENIANFLCDSWFSGAVKDKWNTSSHYPMMLLAQAFMRLLRLWDDAHLELLNRSLIQDRICRVLIQILNQTMMSQNANGTWDSGSSPEITSYSILTLIALKDLPHAKLLEFQIQSAIQSGRQALLLAETRWDEPQYIWVGKVLYGSKILAESYCLAAMHAPVLIHTWNDKVGKIVGMHTKSIVRLSEFFNGLEQYSSEPSWKIVASVVEGFSYLSQLKSTRSEIFPHRESAKDVYLNYIPCSWTVVNNCTGLFVNATLLWEMMVVSMLGFLVDECMESTVAQLSDGDLMSLEQIIHTHCGKAETERHGTETSPQPKGNTTCLSDGCRRTQFSMPPEGMNSESISGGNKHSQPSKTLQLQDLGSLEKAENFIISYIDAMLDRARVQRVSTSQQSLLRATLQDCLLSHIQQIKDNARFLHQETYSPTITKPFLTPRTKHYAWAHTTAASHTSVPISFIIHICNIGALSARGSDCFHTGYQKYMLEDLCSHLAVMTRLSNDYGSIARDRAEPNLNSVNFPEFHPQGNGVEAGTETDTLAAKEAELKSQLLDLVQYERMCARGASRALFQSMRASDEGKRETRVMDAIRLFVGVAEFYADMYVARDLSNRVK